MTAVNTATWTVPVDHPAFVGHFPGRPIVPGVVLLDRALGFVAVARGCDMAGCSIANAKFLSPVGPGETLEFSWQTRASGSIEFEIGIAGAGRAVAAGLLVPPAGS
jgi:3-hydroxymyristoyl/3-hydroxydecanoyl-(acyl carrier protein) dehydratase